MHYAVSHGNFDIVSILLDSKVCDINKQNKTGSTSVMIVAVAGVKSQTHANVVRRLFQMADVNIRAKQHGQTALMLAVSHGRLDMVMMLIEAGADINIQDEDGSTALMCAVEHGHLDIVKYLLSQPDCDISIKDVVSTNLFDFFKITPIFIPPPNSTHLKQNSVHLYKTRHTLTPPASIKTPPTNSYLSCAATRYNSD